MLYRLTFLCCFFYTGIPLSQAQSKFKVDPVLNLQFWSTYTSNQKVFDDTEQVYVDVDNRLNFHLHRSRWGLKGQVSDRLKYSFVTSLDFVGKDVLSGVVGGFNNGASPSIRLWNAQLDYKLSTHTDLFNVRIGYFAPEVSRESITSPFRVNSFEKSWTQNYIRRHYSGTGPGRLTGINLGGFYTLSESALAISYDFGIFNPYYTELSGNSSGIVASNLFTYRTVLHIGNPEFDKHGAARKNNYFGKRKGISLAISQGVQGEAVNWDSNSLLCFDFLANYNGFGLTGEWAQLQRSKGELQTQSATWILRGFYNIPIGNDRHLELVLSRMEFSGPLTEEKQDIAKILKDFYGKDAFTELNINAYTSPNVKLVIAYTWRSGDSGHYNSPASGNNFFVESGAPPIQRGDYLGFGINLSL